MMSYISIFCFVFLSTSVLGKDYFRAAVFEHRHEYIHQIEIDPRTIISSSLKTYGKAVELAAKEGADIIVFNEYGIFNFPFSRERFLKFGETVPDPKKVKFNPCLEAQDESTILYTLSCLAKNNSIYLVANMADIHTCEGVCDAKKIKSCSSDCPYDNVYIYNTDVAFDREGYIVARYHKQKPYFEMVNIPSQPEISTFDTEFGRFGMIVCFDAVFENSVLLAKNHQIDTMLFPTNWFDDIVPLNAVEFQQAWALANHVNFLGANGQNASLGTLGSGIYSKENGALVYTYEPDDKSKLLLANVKVKGTADVASDSLLLVVDDDGSFPQTETGEKFPEYCYEKLLGIPKNFSDYRCYTIQTENYTVVKLESPSGDIQACSNGFCCFLKYTAKDMQDSFYLAAFSGLNNVRGFYHWWEESCLLVRCDSFEDKPCALLSTRSSTEFHEAVLSAKFQSERIYPTVTETMSRLVSTNLWQVVTNNSETKLTFSGDTRMLLKIALLGRSYDRDPPYVSFHKIKLSSSGSSVELAFLLLLAVFAYYLTRELTQDK